MSEQPAGNAPALNKRALLIINPVSGKKMVLRYIPQIIRIFMDAGYLVSTMVTARRGEATELTRQYSRDFDFLCCTGGDGTLNEVVTGLAMDEIHRPLGYIPCGSTNDFAVSRNLSLDILQAAENIASGRRARYDIARFGDQYFSYVAAFGAFSWLSYTTDQNLKNMLGHTAYILDGIKDLSKIKPLHMALTVDGVRYEGDFLFGAVSNSTSIAGTLELPKDQVDTCDGLFEVLLIRVPETILDLDPIVRGLLGQDYSCPFITFTRGKNIVVENPEKVLWALDGEESVPFEKLAIKILPAFLELQG